MLVAESVIKPCMVLIKGHAITYGTEIAVALEKKDHNSDEQSFQDSVFRACHQRQQRDYIENNANDASRCGCQGHWRKRNPLDTRHRSNGLSCFSCAVGEPYRRESRVHSESSSCERRH